MSEPDIPLDQQEFDDPNDALEFAIAWCDRPEVSGDFPAMIRRAHAAGADLEHPSEDGETPLVQAIQGGMGAPSAVAALLELGADPSARAPSGWTPWGTCRSRIEDRVVSDRMQQIESLLAERGADRSDERPLAFHAALLDADRARVDEMIQEGIDLAHPILDPVLTAVGTGDRGLLRLVLSSGVDAEGNDRSEDAESPLARAAIGGHLDLVQLLVQRGADPARFAYGDPRCTPERMARDSGHDEVADWLASVQAAQGKPARPSGARHPNPKLAILYEERAADPNGDQTTDDLAAVLDDWDTRFGIELSEVGHDRMQVRFTSLPDDLAHLCQEIYAFCPDIVEQGYACMDQMAESYEEMGREMPAELQALIEGIDFQDEGFALEIFRRDLAATRAVGLWWD